jgi:predicted transcriptional regulator
LQQTAVAGGLELDLSSRSYFYLGLGRRMSLTVSFKRRSFLAICIAILKTAKSGVKKTHLLCSASLSYEQLIRYVEFLKAHGLIEEYDSSYHTTQKGLRLIEEYESSSLIRGIAPA